VNLVKYTNAASFSQWYGGVEEHSAIFSPVCMV